MPGTKTFTTSAALLLTVAGVLSAATAEYLPLQVGNSWVYKVTINGRWYDTQGRAAAEPQTVEVEARETYDGREYFRLNFFGRKSIVRALDDGSLLAYDTATKQETSWLPLGSPEGTTFQTDIDNCTTSGRIESRNTKVTVPMGEFSNALRVSYKGPCADAGVTDDYFLPFVGLLRHVTTSIAGPVQYDLIYARSGFTSVDVSQLSFTMALDASTYPGGTSSRAIVRLTLRNTLSTPVSLVFPSGQSFDLKVYNDRGESVYTWSADKLFPAIFRTESLASGGERSYALTVPLERLPNGRYLAEAYLTTQPRQFSATVGFEIASTPAPQP